MVRRLRTTFNFQESEKWSARREKRLSSLRMMEFLHLPFLFANDLIRVFDSVIQVFMRSVVRPRSKKLRGLQELLSVSVTMTWG